MSDAPRAGLEEPLLEARQGPTLDGDRQAQPAQQIAEVIGDAPRSSRASLARKRWQRIRLSVGRLTSHSLWFDTPLTGQKI
jgi:hypothetical protein